MVKKGRKIKATFYTYGGGFGGAKEVIKYSWICSCGREYDSQRSAKRCEDSVHRIITLDNLMNVYEIPKENLSKEEINFIGKRTTEELRKYYSGYDL